MRVLSLFSGGGLGDYGLELAGMEIVGQVEIDDYCQKILALRWPRVPKWGDIRTVSRKNIEQSCGRIDLISGGFPCQDISQAGKGVGITGARSGLWKEMLRIICEVRPRYVLVENVSALLGRGLGVVLGDLAKSGYDCEWDCIPASAVGAPHQRDRVWIVGYAKHVGFDGSENGQGDFERNDGNEKGSDEFCQPSGSSGAWEKDVANTISDRRTERRPVGRGTSKKRFNAQTDWEQKPNSSDVGQSSKNVSDTESKRGKLRTKRKQVLSSQSQKRIFGSDCHGFGRKFWSTEPNVGRVAHGVAKRVDRLKLLGNGQVVQVVQWIGERIMEFNHPSQ